MATTVTSREFNQDTGRAKRAAEVGPVYITDRGRPSHVLLTIADYQRLAMQHPTITDLLSEPAGIEHIEFEIPFVREVVAPARFD